MNEQTTDNVETTEESKGGRKNARRPSRKQFAYARKVAAAAGVAIPDAALYNAKAMSGFITAHTANAS